MTATRSHLLSFGCIALGLVLVVAAQSSLVADKALAHSHNPFAVQRSAYGKLLARLSETTIDRVWHLGVEQIVPHYMSGEAHNVAHQKKDHDHDDAAPKRKIEENPIDFGKRWINERVVAQHTRTNPNSLTKPHLATVYREIQEMLLRSFKLDPTHFGAYDSYHLFLTTTDFGGNPFANEQARRIASVAIHAAKSETEDPEPWLTAAAAGMNLFLLDSGPYNAKNEPIPLEILQKYDRLIGECLRRFEIVQASCEKAGNWGNLSLARQREITERSLFLSRTHKQFGTLIARAEERLKGAPTEGEVAKSPEGSENPEP